MKVAKSNSILFAVLVLVNAIMGCGNPLESSSTDGIEFTPQALGMDYCYTCHNVPGSNQGFEQIFVEWIQSRHANFDFMWNGPADPFANTVLYNSIAGNPPLAFCGPCHDGAIGNGNVGGSILDSNVGGVLFPDPNLGEITRPLIDCEACHVSGQGHFGSAAPPEVAIPAFHQCTECHPPTDQMLILEAFADAAHTDNHGPDSNRMWAYAGSILYDVGGPAPIFTNRVLGSSSFGAYVLSAGWLVANGGSWIYDSHETINNTHYQDIWVTNIPNELVVYTSNRSKFGYVDLTNTSPNTGMVRADSVDSCTASCHGAHEFDLTINEQWFHGAHNIEPLGPVNEMYPFGPVLPLGSLPRWLALEYPFSSNGFDSECRRCHSSEGFAEVAPDFDTPAGYGGGLITCNACHDGENYPRSGDPVLRFSGTVSLFDYKGDPLAVVQAGNSAVCVYCHQGREDGSRIDSDIASGSPQFRDMHYLAAGATLYGKKGFEYSGETYAGEHTLHALAGCSGCHMALDYPLDDVGGHTFHMAHGSTENTGFCAASCHPTMSALASPGAPYAHTADWDGNGGTVSAKDEVAYLLTVLLHDAIEAYDNSVDGDTAANINYTTSYPYFNTNTGQTWDAPLAKATFNWQFISKDPGAYTHNPRYAVQLLRDSYSDLAANQDPGAPVIPPLGGVRP